MNIYDVSKRAGVSIATVSRVLNGNEKVSEKTRQKVLAVMEETGYTPNAFARGLGLDTMKTIGILCADSSDSFLASAVYYIERELRGYNYDVLLCCTGYELETKQKYLELLLSKRVDAVILVGSNFVETTKEKNSYIADAAKRVPVIILNGFFEAENVYCALCDDAETMCRVTKSYLKAEKTDILYIGRSFSYSGIRKKEGFMRAYQEMGIKLRENQMIMLNGTIQDTRDFLIERAKQGIRESVILTSDDELAIGAIKYAGALGIKIPDELEIVGYNNSKLGICCEPELSTVDNKLEFSCMNAVTVLMKVLEGSQVPAKTMVSADVIVRNTTKICF
ncbi:MAG: LacI family DNA-binding transcriptional regulator [Lachnospiraceae bacterium]|nr:LacI family DNA-binding transcriptional regulator [Lachnospiraceae bacterium]